MLCSQVPFIAMYRKEECLSLFKDPNQHEADIDNHNKADQKRAIRWHKVNELDVDDRPKCVD